MWFWILPLFFPQEQKERKDTEVTDEDNKMFWTIVCILIIILFVLPVGIALYIVYF